MAGVFCSYLFIFVIELWLKWIRITLIDEYYLFNQLYSEILEEYNGNPFLYMIILYDQLLFPYVWLSESRY